MELKEFIKTAISDITGAISELQTELKNGTIVNPALEKAFDNTSIRINNKLRKIEKLDFDVAVTISETTGIGGAMKAGISILGAKLGTEQSASSQNVSRLTFSIPVLFPVGEAKSDGEKEYETQLNKTGSSLKKIRKDLRNEGISQSILEDTSHDN